MPPSGYNTNQADYVAMFLVSCGASLASEAFELGLTPTQGLEREISNINSLMSSSNFSHVELALFDLNRQFYLKLLSDKPPTYDDFDSCCHRIAREIQSKLICIENRTKEILIPPASQVSSKAINAPSDCKLLNML
jgi:hypothetical protein